MGYAEGNTHGYTSEDAKLDMMWEMYWSLSTKVDEYIKKEGNSLIAKDWDFISAKLTPHYEEYPTNWRTDEYGNEDCDYEQELVSYADTCEDEIAEICWLCGFNLDSYYDYYDGSPRYTISLPDTYEQVEQNMADAKKWYDEVIG